MYRFVLRYSWILLITQVFYRANVGALDGSIDGTVFASDLGHVIESTLGLEEIQVLVYLSLHNACYS